MAKAGFGAIISARLDEDPGLHRALAAHRHGPSALGLMVAICWIFRGISPGRVDKWFRRLQLVSAAGLQPGARRQRRAEDDGDHRRRAGGRRLPGPGERSSCRFPGGSICRRTPRSRLGTLSGGWRIIHTMGSKITKLTPMGGFAAETAGAVAIFTATHFGVPRQHDAHHHRRDRRRRRRQAAVGRALGRRPAGSSGPGS